MHEQVDGPAVRSDGVVQIVQGRLKLCQHLRVLQTHKLGLGCDGHPRQELVHVISLLHNNETRELVSGQNSTDISCTVTLVCEGQL